MLKFPPRYISHIDLVFYCGICCNNITVEFSRLQLSSIPGLDDVTVPSGGRPEPVGGESTNVTTLQQPDSEPNVDSAPLPTKTVSCNNIG